MDRYIEKYPRGRTRAGEDERPSRRILGSNQDNANGLWKYLCTVNVVIFAGGKFRENVGKTFHVGVIFTILLIYPSERHMGFIFAWG